MAYNGWLRFGEVELVNISRTAQLAQALGINAVRVQPASVAWIQMTLGGDDYDDITTAPWYDAQVPASAEFAGLLPLDLSGLNDSSVSSTPIEYIGAGGSTGRPRASTLSMVASAILVGSTERGVEYGKRWVERVLAGAAKANCAGENLTYFRYKGMSAPRVHRRDVKMTRGPVITQERSNSCAFLWWTTFTLTAGDPLEYGDPILQFTGLGGPAADVVGPGVATKGNIPIVAWESCPVYDYSPIQDPLNPALLAGPEMPEFYPVGWNLGPGVNLNRQWVRLNPVEPSLLNVVPMIELNTTLDARRLVVSVFPAGAANTEQCDPLFSVVVNYLPAGGSLFVDAEQELAYFWDGTQNLRRADSVVFSKTAGPVDWTAFNDPAGFLVTLDLPWIEESATIEGGGNVRASMAFIPRSG